MDWCRGVAVDSCSPDRSENVWMEARGRGVLGVELGVVGFVYSRHGSFSQQLQSQHVSAEAENINCIPFFM